MLVASLEPYGLFYNSGKSKTSARRLSLGQHIRLSVDLVTCFGGYLEQLTSES